MAEGMSFSFPSLLFHEGRTYGQPEVVRISLPQVATGLRLCLPGSFRRRGFQPDLLMPQEALFARGAHSMQAVMHRALLRRSNSSNTCSFVILVSPSVTITVYLRKSIYDIDDMIPPFFTYRIINTFSAFFHLNNP